MSLAVISTCTSFSACTNVSADTAGPTGAAVPNAGGAPGVLETGALEAGVLDAVPPGGCCAPAAIAAPTNPIPPFAKNSLRDLAMPASPSG